MTLNSPFIKDFKYVIWTVSFIKLKRFTVLGELFEKICRYINCHQNNSSKVFLWNIFREDPLPRLLVGFEPPDPPFSQCPFAQWSILDPTWGLAQQNTRGCMFSVLYQCY